MTPIDYVILVFAALFGLVGFRRGFVIGVLSFAGFAGGAYLGTRFGPQLLDDGHKSPFAPLFGLLGALVGGVIISAGAEGLGGAVRGAMAPGPLRVVDGLLGSALAIALALGIAWLASVIVLQTPGIREYRATIQRSTVLQELNEVLPSDKVLKALARFDPFPQISGPNVDVDPPRSSVARDPDVKAAGDSVVRVLGNACGLGVAGSGWVAATGVVVTNAHVVAGQEETVVVRRGSNEQQRATVIAFDTRNDVAVLSVPSLGARPLQVAREVKVTEPGAALGYPGNGPFRTAPVRVGRTGEIRTKDAYGKRVVRRTVTAFRGVVLPGNSGGPLVDVAGRVSGTVFSKALLGPQGGYAVPNDIVARNLRRARGPVDTGPCAT